jgi:hypothetical protein
MNSSFLAVFLTTNNIDSGLRPQSEVQIGAYG